MAQLLEPPINAQHGILEYWNTGFSTANTTHFGDKLDAVEWGRYQVTSAQYARLDSETCAYGGGGSRGLLLRCVLVAAGLMHPRVRSWVSLSAGLVYVGDEAVRVCKIGGY